jgi:hypothetical protein
MSQPMSTTESPLKCLAQQPVEIIEHVEVVSQDSHEKPQMAVVHTIHQAFDEHPGAGLITGFVLGGVAGWLTSRIR